MSGAGIAVAEAARTRKSVDHIIVWIFQLGQMVNVKSWVINNEIREYLYLWDRMLAIQAPRGEHQGSSEMHLGQCAPCEVH